MLPVVSGQGARIRSGRIHTVRMGKNVQDLAASSAAIGPET